MTRNMRSLVFFAFFCSALFLVKAAPSGILGLGDSGGENRDNSVNDEFVLKQDSFMSGKNNVFIPSNEVKGINGVGTPGSRDKKVFNGRLYKNKK
ncbi:uncharacterized protein EV154DRAFT_495783 [Mucor mucedo]|uniref:uncharacterized protein n=1 Tax=Mucor mucedo TaxID=29922 RepID=UPI00221EC4AB|nr:uncharacterized protein EV154DRAFT_495783 [Mucor mucedo]KAI7895380.1 hypothetical protein EV154DRAFT_495783 [Mucor mucedo]